jgi:hypothetical protein
MPDECSGTAGDFSSAGAAGGCCTRVTEQFNMWHKLNSPFLQPQLMQLQMGGTQPMCPIIVLADGVSAG